MEENDSAKMNINSENDEQSNPIHVDIKNAATIPVELKGQIIHVKNERSWIVDYLPVFASLGGVILSIVALWIAIEANKAADKMYNLEYQSKLPSISGVLNIGEYDKNGERTDRIKITSEGGQLGDVQVKLYPILILYRITDYKNELEEADYLKYETNDGYTDFTWDTWNGEFHLTEAARDNTYQGNPGIYDTYVPAYINENDLFYNFTNWKIYRIHF